MSVSPAATPIYKGKVTHRSWPQLPQELIRHIATFFLWDLSATNYCPQVWDAREHWHSRMVYASLRDATDLEKFMSICPQWSLAVETHLFWQQAIALIDPLDTLGHHAVYRPNPALTHSHNSSSQPPLPIRLTPYRHFRNITSCSCLVCRINSPSTSIGLAHAKRTTSTPFLGPIALCRDHNHRRIAFCGLCLREAPAVDNDSSVVSCLENEDEDTWPGVEATCRTCRSEWLWRRVCNNPRDREAIGGSKLSSPDWETRQTVEGFIDLAEGTIADVIILAQEKHWLRKHTKLPDMMSQALAASRFTGREDALGYDHESESELDLSEAEEEEDDTDLMQMTEETGGIRELAISDWARKRILDGHWFSPADQWYGNSVPNRGSVVRAEHPCPWTRDADEQEDGLDGEETHPRLSTIRGEVPPSFTLCEQAYVAYQRQMRAILLPAMKNVVRRVVIECGADGVDPAMKAARMGMEDVLAELREEAVWFDGIDWLEKRRNARREQAEMARRAREEGSDDSSSTSASSKSGGSHTTSPVLSTTTLQTTPSPPPSDDKKEDNDLGVVARSVTIAVGPVLDPPRLLRPIPYVPVTLSHMPQYSLESFKMVWREACAPLYHCRCKICERAMVKVNGGDANGPVVPSQAHVEPTPVYAKATEKPVEIKLEEVIDVDGEGEEEIEEDEDADSRVAEDRSRSSYSPPARLRKRSCDEIEDEDEDPDAEGEVDDDILPRERPRGGTPPKRARREGPTSPLVIESPTRMRKRSSEELEFEAGEADGVGMGNKRMKVSVELDENFVESPPTSITGTGESDSNSVPSAGDEEDVPEPLSIRRRRTGGRPRVSQADLDDLYVLVDD